MQGGNLAVPADYDEWTIHPDSTTEGSGTLLSGTPQAGNYTISCTANCSGSWTIDIDIQNVNPAALKQFQSFTGDYDGTSIGAFPASGLDKPDPPKTLKIGASAQYTNGVPNGETNPSYSIVVTAN